MRQLPKLLCSIAVLTASAAFAQVEVKVSLPTITFEAPPPLVVITPGVQVVEDYGHEVFFTDGHYWYRDGDRWYRARDHRGGWVVVERHVVPVTLVKYKPGKFKHYKVKKTTTVVHSADGHDRVKVKQVTVKKGHGHGKH